MTPVGRNYITYYRVSTQQQGKSGLGLDAQKTAVMTYLGSYGGQTLASFTEIESGKDNERPELHKALKRCRQTRATLLVAKLDRLSRNAAFLLSLRDAGVRFVAADMPEANEAMIGFMAVMAQYERDQISHRTRVALAAAKARGTRLGNPNLRPGTAENAALARSALVSQATARAVDLNEVIMDAQQLGKTSLRQIAEHMNTLGIATPRGSQWTAAGIQRLRKYIS
jgi:DNA invertase Pin-like site-specific DNA recombinase